MRTGRRDAAWRSLDAADEPDVGIFERRLAHRDAANLSRGDRGDERGHGALSEARLYPQHLPQLALLDDDRVDEVECAQPFDRRRVEPEDARPMQQRSGEMQPLLHAARVALNALVSPVAEVYESEQLLHPRGDLAWRDGIELTEVAKIVSTGEPVVEPALAAK